MKGITRRNFIKGLAALSGAAIVHTALMKFHKKKVNPKLPDPKFGRVGTVGWVCYTSSAIMNEQWICRIEVES